MAMTDWTIITRSMSARLFSTVTTSVTVAVAVGLLLTLLTMAESGRDTFKRGSGNMHLLVTAEPSPLVAVLNNIFYSDIPKRPLGQPQLRLISSFGPSETPPGVTPGFAIPTQIGDSYRGSPVVATTPEFFSRFEPTPGSPWKFNLGRPFDKNLEVVVGSQAQIATGLALGDQVVFTHGSSDSRGHGGHVHDEFKFTVVGVLQPTGTAHDRALFTSLESSWMMHAFDRLEKEGKISHDHSGPATEAPIKPEDLTDADKRVTAVFLRLPTREGSDLSSSAPSTIRNLRSDPGIQVATPVDEINKLFSIVGVLDKILLGMAGVVVLGSGISITLALYNSMEQRRRQIAILRVLGCSRFRIFGLVMTEAAVLGLLGSIGGVVLSLVGTTIVSVIMFSSYGVQITPSTPPDVTLAVVAGSVFLAALAGLLPAVLAYRTPVANNLRPVG